MAISSLPDSIFGDTISFASPYFTASAAPAVGIPALYDISINGRGYKAETSFEPYRRDAYRSDSIVPVADKTDITNIPGESSINTEGLWRREAVDWSKGAGQLYKDRRGSDDARFYKSKGINPWTQWYATLLNDTTQLRSSTTITQVISCAGYMYIIDNGNVYYSTTGATWTACTGMTAGAALQIATDGYYVYIACGSHGIFLGTIGTAACAGWITGTVNSVWYLSGQLICAAANLLYSIQVSPGTSGPTALTAAGPGGATALLMTQLNPQFVWTVAAAGNSWIYVGGASSTTAANIGLVYKTQVNSAGTFLISPAIASSLPFGETPYALYSYGNFILMGTNFGARLCETLGINDPGGNAGDLKIGPIVPDLVQQVVKPVRCFAGYFRFIYFGWSNYDAVSTGLGRMDLSTFIDAQAPAYTSDLMVTGQGEVLSADWFNSAPVFVVKGLGLYTQSTALVPTGTIDEGFVTYGLMDDKIALYLHLNALGYGSVGAVLNMDDGAYTQTVPGITPNTYMQVPLNQLRGEQLDVQILLNSGAGEYDTTTTYDNTAPYDGSIGGPTLRRWTVKSLPAVVSGTLHKVIINLWSTNRSPGGPNIHTDAYKEFLYLDSLRQSATPVVFQEGTTFSVTVVIKSITRLIYESKGTPEGGFQQRFEVVMSSLEN